MIPRSWYDRYFYVKIVYLLMSFRDLKKVAHQYPCKVKKPQMSLDVSGVRLITYAKKWQKL